MSRFKLFTENVNEFMYFNTKTTTAAASVTVADNDARLFCAIIQSDVNLVDHTINFP